jgi:folylpolyglutamate synthase
MLFSLHIIKGEMAKPELVLINMLKDRSELIPFIDRNLKKSFSAEVQEHYAKTWGSLDPTAMVLRKRTIEGALDRAREIGDQNNGMQALVIGSLHLVSGALYLLESNDRI